MTQGLRALVTNSRLGAPNPRVAVRYSACLHEDEELIFRSETLPLDARFHR